MNLFRKLKAALKKSQIYLCLKIKILLLYKKVWHFKRLKRLKSKKKIKVSYLIAFSSQWKYDELFQLMLKSVRFEPVIIIIPPIYWGDDVVQTEMDKSIKFFTKKKYPLLDSRNGEGGYCDLKKRVKADIVFFQKPVDAETIPEYTIWNYLDVLTCYVPYYFMVRNEFDRWNYPLNNLAWLCFLESKMHVEIAKQNSYNKGNNVVNTGYLGLDQIMIKLERDNTNKNNKKHVIFAPHHKLIHSNFFSYAKIISHLGYKYRDKIKITMKPHPYLKSKLYKSGVWSADEIEDFFDTWKGSTYLGYEDGDYLELFSKSDAMIHDCSSFLVEYLLTGNPTLFLKSKTNIKRLNKFGRMAVKKHYLADEINEIEKFLKAVVIEENDYMKSSRERFCNENIIQINGQRSSHKVFDLISKELSS